jgi:hypothetical protein
MSKYIIRSNDYKLQVEIANTAVVGRPSVLPVAIITGAVRNSLVLEGVNDILGEFSCHGYSVATLHKLICSKTIVTLPDRAVSRPLQDYSQLYITHTA